MSLDITIQICAYNGLPLLRSCLDHLARVDYDPRRFEVVVVDDGSTDGTGDAVASFDAPFSLTLMRERHRGIAATRNTGIRAARGDVLLFIDQDTMAAPRLLAEHWRVHTSHPRAIVSGWVRHIVSLDAPRPRVPGLRDLSTSPFWTSNVSVRRRDLVAAGLFDERFTDYGWEDVDTGDRLLALGLTRHRAWRAIVDHVKPHDTAAGLAHRVRRAEASGRSAVVYLRKRPVRRTRLATGLTPARRWFFRAAASWEPALRATVERSQGPRFGLTAAVASELLSGIAYYRSAERALAAVEIDRSASA